MIVGGNLPCLRLPRMKHSRQRLLRRRQAKPRVDVQMLIPQRAAAFKHCILTVLILCLVGPTADTNAANDKISGTGATPETDKRRFRWLVQSPATDIGRGSRAGLLALAGALSSKFERPVELELRFSAHVLDHWDQVRREPHYDLALDAAHFAAYRARRYGFRIVLATGPGHNYRVVTRKNDSLVEREDLRGLRVATLPAPGIPALRLLALFHSTDVPPEIAPAVTMSSALARLERAEVRAALVDPEVVDIARFSTMLVLDEVPAPAISLSPNFSHADQRELTSALRLVALTARGRELLQAAGFGSWRVVKPDSYQDYDRLLRNTWGYRSD